MTTRQRVRVTQCAIKGCPNRVRRSNAYALCISHLVAVWEFVNVDVIPSDVVGHRLLDMPIKKPSLSHIVTPDEVEARRLARRMATIRSAKATGTMYALDTRNDLIKFGWTSRELWERVNQYPPNFRLIASCPGTRADERDLHRSLKLSRAAGREWYNVTPEVVREINSWIARRNIVASQESADRLERVEQKKAAGDVIFPGDDRPLVMWPKFESVEQWFALPHNQPVAPTKTMPAPKSW